MYNKIVAFLSRQILESYVCRYIVSNLFNIVLSELTDRFWRFKYLFHFLFTFGAIFLKNFWGTFWPALCSWTRCFSKLQKFPLFNSFLAFCDGGFGKVAIFWLSVNNCCFLFRCFLVKSLFRTTGAVFFLLKVGYKKKYFNILACYIEIFHVEK